MTQTQTLQYDLLIDGEWKPAVSGDYFDVENPATGETVARMANAGEQDVAEAVTSAERAFKHGPWSAMPDSERGKILWRMADIVEERRMELGRMESISNGRPISETSSQMLVVASYFRYFAGFCDKIQGSTVPDRPGSPQLHGAGPPGCGRAAYPLEPPADDCLQEAGPGPGRRLRGSPQALGVGAAHANRNWQYRPGSRAAPRRPEHRQRLWAYRRQGPGRRPEAGQAGP